MPSRKLTLAEIAVHFDKAIVEVAGLPCRRNEYSAGFLHPVCR